MPSFCYFCVVPYNRLISTFSKGFSAHLFCKCVFLIFNSKKRTASLCLLILLGNIHLKFRGQKEVFYQNVKIQGFCSWKFSGFK